MRSCGRPNAGGSMASAALARMTKVRTKANVGSETPTDARLFCRGIGHGRAPRRRGAHLSAFHRGSRPKESFIARDSASGQASWDVAGHLLRILLAGGWRHGLSLRPAFATRHSPSDQGLDFP